MDAWWKNPPVIPTKYKYRAKHIPTNRSWIREIECAHRGIFLAELARWNRMDPKNWIYTEVVDTTT